MNKIIERCTERSSNLVLIQFIDQQDESADFITLFLSKYWDIVNKDRVKIDCNGDKISRTQWLNTQILIGKSSHTCVKKQCNIRLSHFNGRNLWGPQMQHNQIHHKRVTSHKPQANKSSTNSPAIAKGTFSVLPCITLISAGCGSVCPITLWKAISCVTRSNEYHASTTDNHD